MMYINVYWSLQTSFPFCIILPSMLPACCINSGSSELALMSPSNSSSSVFTLKFTSFWVTMNGLGGRCGHGDWWNWPAEGSSQPPGVEVSGLSNELNLSQLWWKTETAKPNPTSSPCLPEISRASFNPVWVPGTMSRYWPEKSNISATKENSRTRNAISSGGTGNLGHLDTSSGTWYSSKSCIPYPLKKCCYNCHQQGGDHLRYPISCQPSMLVFFMSSHLYIIQASRHPVITLLVSSSHSIPHFWAKFPVILW